MTADGAGAVVEVRWAEPAEHAAARAEAALADRLERFGCRALHHLNYRVEVSVLLCDSRLMQSLNARYRGIFAPTDVLSFAQLEASAPPGEPQRRGAACIGAAGRPGCRDQDSPPPAGDVVIAADVAARQASARGEPAERELCRLLLHGMLHLVGMDHADPPRDREPMLQLQERTLHRLLGDASSATP